MIRCRYFSWRLSLRKGIWQADGRSFNGIAALKRYSLETSDRDRAIENLHYLDKIRAVELRLAPRSVLEPGEAAVLTLEDGRDLYMKHVTRPSIVGGASPAAAKRYRPVFDKFIEYAKSLGITSWQAVTTDVAERYAGWLEDNDYEYGTEYLELTTLKSVNKWMIDEGLIPPTCRIKMRLEKPSDTTTYCYTADEVSAMLEHCDRDPSLRWIGDVITLLAHTGMRISELASARWEDIRGDYDTWEIPDHSRTGTAKQRKGGRTNKGRRSRRVPVHPRVRDVLVRLRDQRRKDGYIIGGSAGGKLKPDRVRIILERDVLQPVSVKITPRLDGSTIVDGKLHSFRHFFCSTCASNGVPERVLMSWLGHADSRMIRRYYHLHDEESRRQMQALRFGTEQSRAATTTDTKVVPESAA